jgi:hypothetical protein
MYVVSTCALPVASWLWQPQPSAWALTVICRATFLLRPVESKLAPEQLPPVEDDEHWSDDERRSLRVASDLAPVKLRADVTLVGHAFAPGGAAVPSLMTRLRVGDIDKSIEVFAERYFDQQRSLHHGSRFTRLPLVWERAAGGPETMNPVGVRAVADTYGRIALPNLQPPGLAITSPADHIPPVAYAPIAPSWPSRREKLGRHAAHGPPPDGQRAPLPEDVDPAYFNHAPRDQQLAELRPDERIILENLHPDHPRLVTNLAGVRPQAVVERRSGTAPVALRCDTLWIDTDRSLCTLTWRAQVPLESPEEVGRVVFSLEGQARPPLPSLSEGTWAQIEAAESVVETLVPTNVARTTAASRILPFAPSAAPAAPPVPRPVPPPAPSAPAAAPPPARGSLWQIADAPSLAAPAPANLTVGQMAAADAPPAPAPAPVAASPAPAAPAAPAPAAAEAARPAAKIELRRALQLVWFDPDCLPRIRKKAAFQPILEAAEQRPLDPDLEDPAISRNPAVIEDRRDVFEVMARAEVADEARLTEAVERALRDDGKYVPPFVLVAGEVRLPFDEIAMLRATVALASPFSAGDEPLRAAIADAREILSAADPMCPPNVIEGFTQRVQEAFRKMRRAAAPATYLEEQAERVLLERRAFQRRQVYGAAHVRALLQFGTSPRPWPLYLPDAAASKLPLFTRFPARLLGEPRLQEDQYEAAPTAFVASALARLAPMPPPPVPPKPAPKS